MSALLCHKYVAIFICNKRNQYLNLIKPNSLLKSSKSPTHAVFHEVVHRDWKISQICTVLCIGAILSSRSVKMPVTASDRSLLRLGNFSLAVSIRINKFIATVVKFIAVNMRHYSVYWRTHDWATANSRNWNNNKKLNCASDCSLESESLVRELTFN